MLAQLPLLAAQLARAHGYQGVVGVGPMEWGETRLAYPELELIELVRSGGATERRARSSWTHRQVAWDPSGPTPPVAPALLGASAVAVVLAAPEAGPNGSARASAGAAPAGGAAGDARLA